MKHFKFGPLLALALFFGACSQNANKDNTLTSEEKKEGWELLFDGETTDGWHLYNQKDKPSVWVVKEGALVCSPETNLEHGDLVTDKKYENYELKFDWKLVKEGNSGVFINVQEDKKYPTAWTTGPEYQLLESSHHDYEIETKRAGCLYGFSPQLNKADLKPLDEWNNAMIRQQNGKIEFYLNGKLTAQQDMTSDEWKDKIAETNFKNFPDFGKERKGQIALQDWNKGVSFKNIKIKEL